MNVSPLPEGKPKGYTFGVPEWLKRERYNALIARLEMESASAPKTFFCSFTFSEEPKISEISGIWRKYYLDLRKGLHRSENRMRALQGLSPLPMRDATVCRAFWCAENGSDNGRLHLHALVFGTVLLSEGRLRRYWAGGISQMLLVKQPRRAARYVSKYLLKKPLLWRPPQRPALGFLPEAENYIDEISYDRSYLNWHIWQCVRVDERGLWYDANGEFVPKKLRSPYLEYRDRWNREAEFQPKDYRYRSQEQFERVLRRHRAKAEAAEAVPF